MIFVQLDGDGDTLVSENAIREHSSKPQEFHALNAEDALQLTGLSWAGEGVRVKYGTEEEGDDLRRALAAKVLRDFNPRSWL
jgi:hypothetical protein